MKRILCCCILLLLWTYPAKSETMEIWRIYTAAGVELTQICAEPSVGDEYISGDNRIYEVVSVEGTHAIAEDRGSAALPELNWMDANEALPVAAMNKVIALYCTHSDESYEPSDGYYTTNQRGTIYQIATELADAMRNKGIEASVADQLHHPHDAGAYRRSRQTAVALIKQHGPDCLIDIHRDGIPDPNAYAVEIGGEKASKIRLLVGRGNQNAALNKEFALTIKAIADRVYPGLIKDIYLGKGTFNQDLLPKSILLECGTYTLEKERVIRSMPMMADVLNRALFGGVVGSAGRIITDSGMNTRQDAPKVSDTTNEAVNETNSTGQGFGFLIVLAFVGVVCFAVLATGSLKGGFRKAERNLHEMTGGLLGRAPRDKENPNQS